MWSILQMFRPLPLPDCPLAFQTHSLIQLYDFRARAGAGARKQPTFYEQETTYGTKENKNRDWAR